MHSGKKFVGLDVERFEICSKKVEGKVRIALVSDLHGVDRVDVCEQLDKLKPDIIAVAGDLFDGVQDPQDALNFISRLKKTCGRILFVSGNHEFYRGDRDLLYGKLTDLGVQLLDGKSEIINNIQFYGLIDERFDDYQSQKSRLQNRDNTDRFEVLLYHRADKFGEVCGLGFPLVLSGHVHGGQWRAGRIGLLGPGNTLFPKYTSGKYEKDGCVLIVSRGLGDHMILPRINDVWHLPVIDLLPCES